MYLSRNQMYGFLDFTGETQEGPFWKQILEGKKKQTIRKPRKDNRPHVLEDRYVKIYWKVRHKKNIDKPIHFVGYAKVVSYEKKSLQDMIFDEEIVKADGFRGLDDFREWFYPEWNQLSPMIQEVLERLQTRQVEYVVQSRGLGKSTLRELLKPLSEEYYVIKWDEFIPSEEAKELRKY